MNSEIKELYSYLIGKNVTEARQMLPESMLLRVTRKDGQPLVNTMDFKDNRLKVSVKEGKIDDILGIG